MRKIGIVLLIAWAVDFVAFCMTLFMLCVLHGMQATCPEWFNIWGAITWGVWIAGWAIYGLIFLIRIAIDNWND